jgi:hypothetical protein
MRALPLTLALLLLAAPALAEDEARIAPEARAGLTVMGGARSTGGLTLGAGMRYLRPFGERGPWGWYAGAAADAVGVGDSWYWLGLLAGPEAGVWRNADTWRLSAGLSLPMGQIPTCNDWNLCVRHWGLFPAGAARVTYGGDSGRVGLEAGAQYVNTLSWTGAAWQVRIVGSYR